MGNDIVDLSLPAAKDKYLDQRFLQRVFTQAEQCCIVNSSAKNKLLWSIWAAKEASFKAGKKFLPPLVFAHKAFYVAPDTLTKFNLMSDREEFYGELYYQDLRFLIRWQWNLNVVSSLAILQINSDTVATWKKIQTHLFRLDDVPNLTIKAYFSENELSSFNSEESLLTRFYAKKFLHRLGFEKNIEILRPERGPPILQANSILFHNEISLSHDGGWGEIAVSF